MRGKKPFLDLQCKFVFFLRHGDRNITKLILIREHKSLSLLSAKDLFPFGSGKGKKKLPFWLLSYTDFYPQGTQKAPQFKWEPPHNIMVMLNMTHGPPEVFPIKLDQRKISFDPIQRKKTGVLVGSVAMCVISSET